ncbi:MAG: alpha/beta hydrolase [Hylemonella sp.]|nr:alpha/beta hydrolase [Hylemonella sp.]
MTEAAGPTWILLRGLTREAAHWGGFVEALRRALPQSRVLTLDLPGNGQWHTQRSPADVSAMVASCRAELSQRGVQGPVYLLAMSLGAMVATEWAYQAPGQVAGCVLINTSLRPFSPFFHRLRPRNYGRLLGLVLGRATPAGWEQAILRLTSNRAVERAAVLPDWIAVRQSRPVNPGNALRQLLAAARYRVRNEPPATRLLLLASKQDGLVDVRCSSAVAQRWGCTLQLHPTAGHDLPLDEPAWVIAQVQHWLGDRSSVPRA